MKLVTALAVLLFQAGHIVQSGPPAEPAHLRYVRTIEPSAAGPACATADATLFAHSASRTAEDIRLFDAAGRELPYVLTESSSLPEPPAPATVLNARADGSAIAFDLAMPTRPYSEIDLRLNAHDFIASARVTDQATGANLGTFTLFDLASQHLARSVTLALQETTVRTLHVTLRAATLTGEPLPLAPSAVVGADVPASREAQTLYTPALTTSDLRQDGPYTLAAFNAPAHVPIERVRIQLDPAFKASFLRPVDVKTYIGGQSAAADDVRSEIFRLDHPTPPSLDTPAIHAEHLAVNAPLGANLREAARVVIAIENGKEHPLPIRSVELEMRERRLCFAAAPGETYTLRYGDPALRAPVYDYAHLFNTAARSLPATLGPEQLNPIFAPRADTRPYTDRHPELLWISLLALVTILGAIAIGSLKHQRRIQ